jgi:hypothetical protein
MACEVSTVRFFWSVRFAFKLMLYLDDALNEELYREIILIPLIEVALIYATSRPHCEISWELYPTV